jgi:hypothetical protein
VQQAARSAAPRARGRPCAASAQHDPLELAEAGYERIEALGDRTALDLLKGRRLAAPPLLTT